jgi:hypothetical protein
MIAVLFLVFVAGLPTGVAVQLGLKGQWSWVAAVTAATGLPLQLAGLGGTCTQGADGPFITGTVFSAPFLLVAITSTLGAVRQRRADLRGAIATGLVAVATLLLCKDAFLNTLRYGSPCGEYFSFYPSDPTAALIIVGGYLVLPLLLAGVAAFAAHSAWKRRVTP